MGETIYLSPIKIAGKAKLGKIETDGTEITIKKLVLRLDDDSTWDDLLRIVRAGECDFTLTSMQGQWG